MADKNRFIAVKDGVKTKVIVEDIKQADGSIKRSILGLSVDDNIQTLDTYLDLVKLLASTANKYENKMFFIKDMKDFDKYEPTASVHFKPGEPGLVYFDNDKVAIAATGSGVRHYIKIETEGILTVGTWNELNAKITAGEKNKIYKVEDMAGYPGFADNEHAFWYLNGTTTPDLVSRDHGIYSSAADELLLNNIQELQFSSGSTGTPGTTPSLSFGDLSNEDERHAFMENALEEKEYSVKIGGTVYSMVVKTKTGDGTKDTDTITVEGFKYGNGEMEPHTFSVKRAGVENNTPIGMKASKYEFSTVKTTYTDTEALPNSVIAKKIKESDLTGNYDSQVPNLKVIESLSDLTPGLTKEYTFPNGLTSETVGGCQITMNYSIGGEVRTKTQGFDLRGWDGTRPLYLPITYHSDTTYLWVEVKMEAVAGDNTKYKLTNYKSGAGSNEMNAFGVNAIQFRGGQ